MSNHKTHKVPTTEYLDSQDGQTSKEVENPVRFYDLRSAYSALIKGFVNKGEMPKMMEHQQTVGNTREEEQDHVDSSH